MTQFSNNKPIYLFVPQFLFLFAEFQEAFNLFDNRGDGKIQLNQVNYLCLFDFQIYLNLINR